MGTLLNFASLLYILVFAASGIALARLLLPRDRLARRLLFGLTAGLVMLLWFPVLLAFLIDFTLAAQLITLALAAGVGVLSILLYNKKLNNDEAFAAAVRGRAKTELKDERALLLTCVPLVIIGFVLLSNHTITNASDGSLHVGQCTYGDLCMHLGFISSISVQKTFPPEYSILPGTPLGYPFLCDSVSSTFYTLGASLRFAALLPALYAYLVVVLGVYLFFEQWFKRNSIAVIATWLFFIGGGFGFFYFFDNAKTYAGLTDGSAWQSWLNDTYGINASVQAGALDMGQRLMEGWYKTPTNYVSLGLRWVNSIADMLVPQRATLFGWALLFPALQLLHRAAFENERKLFIYLGVLAGAMPLVHTHSFFALGLISAFLIAALFIRKLVGKGAEEDGKMLKSFLLFGVIAVALAAPQLLGFTFKQSGSGGFLKFHWNWCNESDSWLWFYIKNLGFIFLLMPIAFLYTKSENKLFYGGGLLIWAICEFIVFQPNTYDNNKLLFVWFALTCGIVAELIMTLYDRIVDGGAGNRRTNERVRKAVPLSRRIGQRLIFVLLIGSMMLSGVMTIAREYVSADHISIKAGLGKVENGYQVVSAPLVNACEYIKKNTEPDATFLTATNHNNAVAMLTGRNIVCGAGTFLYFHGVDYQGRFNNVRLMYEQPSQYFAQFANEYGVDYVLLSSWERSNYSVDTAFFDSLQKIYEEGGVTIYKVNN